MSSFQWYLCHLSILSMKDFMQQNRRQVRRVFWQIYAALKYYFLSHISLALPCPKSIKFKIKVQQRCSRQVWKPLNCPKNSWEWLPNHWSEGKNEEFSAVNIFVKKMTIFSFLTFLQLFVMISSSKLCPAWLAMSLGSTLKPLKSFYCFLEFLWACIISAGSAEALAFMLRLVSQHKAAEFICHKYKNSCLSDCLLLLFLTFVCKINSLATITWNTLASKSKRFTLSAL